MHTENPDSLPEHIQHTVDAMEGEANKRISAVEEQHDRGSERYLDAIKVLERASAGDRGVLGKVQAVLDAEASGKQYEHEQRIFDAAGYIIDTIGNPYAGGTSVSHEGLMTLCQRAFDSLIKEKYDYFQKG